MHCMKNRFQIRTSLIKVNILNGYGLNEHKYTRNVMHYNFSLFFFDTQSLLYQFMENEKNLQVFLEK